jgi:exosortase
LTELNPQASMASGDSAGSSSLDRYGYAGTYDTGALGLSMETWVKIWILAPLFIAVYWLVLRWLWDKTNPLYGEANWGHAICIPAVGLYYLYINREELLRQPVEPLLFGKFMNPQRLYPAVGMLVAGAIAYFLVHDANSFAQTLGGGLAAYGLLVLLLDWGLGSLLFGLAMFAFGIYPGKNQFVQGCAMSVTLFGIVLILSGWKVMKYAWFPIFYLLCGIPWPGLVYSYIASPLQTLAAKVAVHTLQFTGVNAYRTGTKINMGGLSTPLRTLNVAEACAGLRSLMTFITVGVAVAFLSARPLWQKLIIMLSAIPIAIFCNVMRVAGQGLLDHYVSRQFSESFAHQFVGLVMLVPAFFMILLVAWVLDHLFVEEVEDEDGEATVGAGKGPVTRPPAGGVLEIPRRPVIAPVPAGAAKHLTPPRVVPPVAPAGASGAKPQAAPAARPPQVVPPPRPGIVPPRPGIVPPRPGIVPPRPMQQQRPPQPQPPRPPQQPPKETP